MVVAIYGRSLASNKSAYIQQLFDKLHASGIEVCIYHPFHDFIKDTINIRDDFKLFKRQEDIAGKVKLLISLGGDGTLLETLEVVKNASIPVMGINTGRLGFLSSISKEEINFAVDAVMNNKYVIDKRTMLQLEGPTPGVALNDITISRSESSSMIIVHAYINNEFLNSYHADGLIISTPTGSTAYSLSCGGPIVMPDSEDFVITPIAPHNLNVRPLVISDHSVLRLKVESRTPRFMITLDSRSMDAGTGTELLIRKAPFCMNIIKLENHDFLATLRSKLNWGFDKRN